MSGLFPFTTKIRVVVTMTHFAGADTLESDLAIVMERLKNCGFSPVLMPYQEEGRRHINAKEDERTFASLDETTAYYDSFKEARDKVEGYASGERKDCFHVAMAIVLRFTDEALAPAIKAHAIDIDTLCPTAMDIDLTTEAGRQVLQLNEDGFQFIPESLG